MKWLRQQAGERLTGSTPGTSPKIETPPFFGNLGIFITLKKGKKIRGCYGAFYHSYTDIGGLLADYLAGALTRDHRYPPLDIAELPDTEIILTVTSMPLPVSDLGTVDLHRYGILMVCDGDETAVFVPAEIRTVSFIERFSRGKTCQISAFRAVTIR
jgi:AMMECR1 domain-containing protein